MNNDDPDEKPMISVSHWGMFTVPPKRRISDREIPPVIIKYRKPPVLEYEA